MRVSDELRDGTELAGYRIASLLGRGGMGMVYLAEDRRLRRPVALKLLAAGLADDRAFRDGFLRESELAASIDHPNIVPIYEAGEADGLLFIAMRYVEGRDLRERLHAGPLDLAEAIGVVAQVASALDAAHARGLVHRDVKPSNVLLDRGARPDASDHVYLADFGLTQRLAEAAGNGDGDRLLGSVDYVAPEQIAGHEVDGRADVYSLGCVLFECLVGEPPFRRESATAVVFAHLDAVPPAPSERRMALPQALDGVIATALAKEPEQRFASCRALVEAALAVAADDASRALADLAARTAAGRDALSEAEAELAGTVIDLRSVRQQARALADPLAVPGSGAAETCPFKGLASYEPADAELFFGRERLLSELVARLAGARFLGIVGPSGSGKSSVLRAGLLPALADDALPGSGRWRQVLLRPGERPMDALRESLGSAAADPVAAALDALPPGGRLVLAIDQLEELFTACSSDAERAAFVDALVGAADAHGRAVVVVALRADYYGRTAAHPALAELLGANNLLVGALHAAELRRVIELPSRRVGVRVEPALTDALIADVEGEPGALPLLSTALLELWQKRRDGTLTLAAYRESGRVDGAVARLAEATYARIPEAGRPLVRAIMLRLVGEGEAGAAVRRRAPLAELDLDRDGEAAGVLAILADQRLVTVGDGVVEVAHEALLREWPRLRDWIDEDAEGRRLHEHLREAARDWDAAGRDAAELYRGARLAAALDYSDQHALDLNELERAFLCESQADADREAIRARRTNRRLRALLAGVAVLLAAAVVGGVLALAQRGEARDAETAQVAQRLGGQALVEEDLDRALLLARQAVAIDDSPQTRSSLLATLMRAPSAVRIMHGSDDALFWAEALSPDGGTLAVADLFGRILFFDARTYEQIGDPITSSWVDSIAYSPDGATLAFGGQTWVRLVDARTHVTLAEGGVWGHPARMRVHARRPPARRRWSSARSSCSMRTTLQREVDSIELEGFRPAFLQSYSRWPHVALTPDGRSVLTASDGGELAWWDLQSRRKIAHAADRVRLPRARAQPRRRRTSPSASTEASSSSTSRPARRGSVTGRHSAAAPTRRSSARTARRW